MLLQISFISRPTVIILVLKFNQTLVEYNCPYSCLNQTNIDYNYVMSDVLVIIINRLLIQRWYRVKVNEMRSGV